MNLSGTKEVESMERPREEALSAEAKEYIAFQDEVIARLNRQAENQANIIANLQKRQFGISSEKRKPEVAEGCEQLSLFNEAEAFASEKAEDPTAEVLQTQVKAHSRKKARPREEILAGIPAEEKEFELPEESRHCPRCLGALTKIGREYVREIVEYIPARIERTRYYRATYACRSCADGTKECATCEHAEEKRCTMCENRPKTMIVQAEIPDAVRYPVLKHSTAGPTMIAQALFEKFVQGIPFYRQEKEWERLGFALSRETLSNWAIMTSRDYFGQLQGYLRKVLLKSATIHVDETTVQVLHEEGKVPTTQSYMWVLRTGAWEERAIVAFEYQPNRSGESAKKLLEGYEGYYVTDGYAGYNKVRGGTRCGCWAHVRRKFEESKPGAAPAEASKAEQGFQYCQQLFAVERELADASPEVRHAKRQILAKPILDEFWEWTAGIHPMQGTPLARAIGYVTGQKAILRNFLLDGRIPISNNLAENAIRPFVVGRKNWLFCNMPKGASASADLYSVIETAKANNLDPYKYLCFLLDRMPAAKGAYSDEFFERIAPWALRPGVIVAHGALFDAYNLFPQEFQKNRMLSAFPHIKKAPLKGAICALCSDFDSYCLPDQVHRASHTQAWFRIQI